jgi:hypothetical protein
MVTCAHNEAPPCLPLPARHGRWRGLGWDRGCWIRSWVGTTIPYSFALWHGLLLRIGPPSWNSDVPPFAYDACVGNIFLLRRDLHY